jgi:hypothetical protein
MVPSVLIQKSTKEIIKHSDYPRSDMQPVQGMDPDFEWLIVHLPFLEPPYDPRVYIMQTDLPDLQFLSEFQEHPNYQG